MVRLAGHLAYRHRSLLLVLVVFAGATLAQMALLPAFEGGDEGLHLAYTLTIVNDGQLPNRAESATNGARQTSGQPPLYYALAAAVLRLLDLPRIGDERVFSLLEANKNPWYSPPDIWNRLDNRNVYLIGAEQKGVLEEIGPTVRVLRFVSLAFGLAGILGAYGVAREVLRRRLWVMVAVIVFAFAPQYIYMSASFHNDISAYALSALLMWQTLRVLRFGASPFRLIGLGVLIGLAGLSKINALLIAPAAGVAVLLEARHHPHLIARALRGLVILGIPALLIIGPWLFYGYQSTSDLLGTATHNRPGFYYETPLKLVQVLPLLPEVYLGYWGKLASAVYLSPFTYTLLGSVVALAVTGFVISGKTRWWRGRLRQEQILVFGLVVLLSVAGVLYWVQHIHFITGRLAYPVHSVFAVGVASGVALLSSSLGRRQLLACWTMAVLLFAGCISGPVSLIAAYSAPETQTPIPADLLGGPIDFATGPEQAAAIRFLGYRLIDGELDQGKMLRYTLCWQAQENSPPERPAAFSLKLFSQDGQQLADRTSMIGMGRYDSSQWRSGDTICDAVDLPVLGTVEPGSTNNLLLVLLDSKTMAVDWEARNPDNRQVIPIPVIATLVRPAP